MKKKLIIILALLLAASSVNAATPQVRGERIVFVDYYYPEKPVLRWFRWCWIVSFLP